MKLLITTQVVDTEDSFLGFFHGWIKEIARHYESVEVICLKEGKHALPHNVRVHSLGKEHGKRSRVAYAARFLLLAWRLRHSYDAVFVHMNQEYVLLAGGLWRLLGKHVYLWRNHYAGSILTDTAVLFAHRVFCTSRYSYTAKYKKTSIMPLGIDTSACTSDIAAERIPHSILFLSRFAPSKKPDVLLEALHILHEEKVSFQATFVGSALPEDAAYRHMVLEKARTLGLDNSIHFEEGIAHNKTPVMFRSHEVFVNLARSGSYDKTMLEAAACGCLVVSTSKDFAAWAGSRFFVAEPTLQAVADAIREALFAPKEERERIVRDVRATIVAEHSLETLGRRIAELVV